MCARLRWIILFQWCSTSSALSHLRTMQLLFVDNFIHTYWVSLLRFLSLLFWKKKMKNDLNWEKCPLAPTYAHSPPNQHNAFIVAQWCAIARTLLIVLFVCFCWCQVSSSFEGFFRLALFINFWRCFSTFYKRGHTLVTCRAWYVCTRTFVLCV